MPIAAVLAGVELALPKGESISWQLRTGIQPVQTVIQTSKSRADEILRQARKGVHPAIRRRDMIAKLPGSPLTLELGGKEFKGIYAWRVPGRDRRMSGLQLVDKRFWWKRPLVNRVGYNIRRTTGETRWLDGEVVNSGVARLAPDYEYRATSLRDNGTPWTAQAVLEDVLTELNGPNGFKIDPADILFKEPVVDMRLGDDGDRALMRVLAHLAGMDVWVDSQGLTRTINVLRRTEIPIVERIMSVDEQELPTLLEGSGALELIERSHLRPIEVWTYLERFGELRINHDEPNTANSNFVRGREPLDMLNVIAVPDVSITIGDKAYARGSWVSFDDYLGALESAGEEIPGLGPLTQELLRRHALTGFVTLRAAAIALHDVVDLTWARRFAAIETHWRRTYQVRRQWRDKILNLTANRVGIINVETGSLGRAEAFLDHIIRPSEKTLAERVGENFAIGANFEGYSALIKDAVPAPFVVVVLDKDNLVVRLEPRTDEWGKNDAVFPGKLDGPFPVSTAGEARGLWAHEDVMLSADHQISIVVSAVQGAPNNHKRLERFKVGPALAVGRLGITVGDLGKGGNRGAVWEMFIPAARETARVAWTDAASVQLEEAYYSGGQVPITNIVNYTRCFELAKAMAAQIYAVLQDRHEGTGSVSFDPSIVPTGAIAQVTHTLSSGGDGWALLTRVDLKPVTIPPPVMALLPESVRAVLQRQVTE